MTIHGVLSLLGKQEREIARMRFGLVLKESEVGMIFTVEETGIRMKLTRLRVMQLEGKVMRKLLYPIHEMWRKEVAEARFYLTQAVDDIEFANRKQEVKRAR